MEIVPVQSVNRPLSDNIIVPFRDITHIFILLSIFTDKHWNTPQYYSTQAVHFILCVFKGRHITDFSLPIELEIAPLTEH
jgi:hypothetical protein